MDGSVPGAIFGLVTVAAVVVVILFMLPLLYYVTVTPKNPDWFLEYDGLQVKRRSLRSYLASVNKSPDTTMATEVQIATANYGGIFTHPKITNMPWMTPWHGIVSPDAARLQVEAGARAIIFDIWPDPSDLSSPIIACMVDTDDSSSWPMDTWWKNTGGLKHGVSRYSNWKQLTRNKGPAGPIIKTAVSAAFVGPQAEDPFFLILNLHGILSTSYLNNLAAILIDALQGKALGAAKENALDFCKVPLTNLMNKVTVLVNPDVPLDSDRESFNAVYNTTTMKDITNILTTTERGLVFKPTDLGSLTTVKYTDCTGSLTNKVPLPRLALCVVQPTIGGLYTDNDSQFKKVTFGDCQKSGAQFVGINLFGGSASRDAVLSDTWLVPALFGAQSFKVKG